MNRKIFFLIILFFFAHLNSFSEAPTTSSELLNFNKKIPIELQLLISEVYQNKKIQDKDLGTINSYLNSNIQNLSFIRDVLYKFTLSYTRSLGKRYLLVDKKMYDSSTKNMEKLNSSRKFSIFIFQSVRNDLNNLISNPQLKTYALYLKRRERIIPPELTILSRKISFVTPWIRILQEEDSQKLDNKLDIFTSELLKHIMKILKLTRVDTNETSRLVWKLDKKLEDMRKEIDLLTFKISPKASPTYKAPKSLPQATKEWIPIDDKIIENGFPLTRDGLFPQKDPNYVAPKFLPRPIDNWD